MFNFIIILVMKTIFIKVLFLLVILSIYWVYSWVYSKERETNIKTIVSNNWYNFDKISKVEKNNILDKAYKNVAKYNISEEWHEWILEKSIKKYNKWEYKLIIRTVLLEDEIKNTFNFFDDSIKIEKQNNWIYILNIPFNSNIAKSFLAWVEKWVLPKSILNFNIVKPVFVEVDSSSTYLIWEDLSNMWWITAMWADKYQEWLSAQAKFKIWIIDTWIDYNHSDLAWNIYNNSLEIAWNWEDDDENWYIDDVIWYDFYNWDNDPIDDHWHGTHVSGVAWWSVNWGWVFWVNSNVELVWLKVLNASGGWSSYDIWEAIKYAADNWIKVINMSLWWVGDPSDSFMCDSIDYALEKWTISVVAAWNSDTETSMYVPAWCPNAITVSAVDSNLKRAYFSNYWDEVDVSAAGVSVYSSVIWWGYESWNWTSMASPFIAWLVSAMKIYNPSLSIDEIKNIFSNISLTDSVKSHPKKDIWRFANMASIMNYLWINDDDFTWELEPNQSPILDVTIEESTTNIFTLTAIASDNDGTIDKYEFMVWWVDLWDNSNIFNITITEDTSVTVSVTDNDWATTESIVDLVHVLVGDNISPTVSLSSSPIRKFTYSVIADASDTDWTIARYDYYLNWSLLYSDASSSVIIRTKNWNDTVKVIVFDNNWAIWTDSVAIWN